jgi:hypothetical protein
MDNLQLEQILDGLPNSQAGIGRHKCARSAFLLGFEQAKYKLKIIANCYISNDLIDPNEIFLPTENEVSSLPESQKGAARHKCAFTAYRKGVEYGMQILIV